MSRPYLDRMREANVDLDERKKMVTALRMVAREVELGLSVANLDGVNRVAMFSTGDEEFRLNVNIVLPNLLDKRQLADRAKDIEKVEPFNYGAW